MYIEMKKKRRIEMEDNNFNRKNQNRKKYFNKRFNRNKMLYNGR